MALSGQAATQTQPPVQAQLTIMPHFSNQLQHPPQAEAPSQAQLLVVTQSPSQSQVTPYKITDIQALLETPAMQRLIRYSVTPEVLTTEHERRILRVMLAMAAHANIRDAVWYLEDTDWDTNAAIQQSSSIDLTGIIRLVTVPTSS